MVPYRSALVWIKLLFALAFILLLLAEMGFALYRIREAGRQPRRTASASPTVGHVFNGRFSWHVFNVSPKQTSRT
jgi:hypothetical protein